MLLHASQMFRAPLHSQAAYDAHCARECRTREVEVIEVDESIEVYVSGGRLVADCRCRGGIAAPDPAFGSHGVCLTCGRRYRLHYPPFLDAVVALLEPRPVENQNFLPGETVQTLERENALMAHHLSGAG